MDAVECYVTSRSRTRRDARKMVAFCLNSFVFLYFLRNAFEPGSSPTPRNTLLQKKKKKFV
jgi:hypothetical protein